MTAAFNATIAIAERYITSSDGTAVFAQAVGDNRLPTLVFIHGLAMSALVWANILRDTRLLEFFQLVAYDMRGHGRSGKPDTEDAYRSESFAQDFDSVIKAFNVTSPILVNRSLGATIAADVTTYLGPDALAGIVYTAGAPALADINLVGMELVQRLIPGLSATEDSDLSLSSRIEFNTQLLNYPERLPTEVLWGWIGGSTLQPPSKFGYLLSKTQDTTNLFKAAADGVPLLVMNGGADKFVNGTKVVELIDGRFKDLTVHTVTNGSHAFFYEEQDEYVRELSKFAKRVFASRLK